MRSSRSLAFFVIALVTIPAVAQSNNPDSPSWWNKYQTLLQNGAQNGGGKSSSVTAGNNETEPGSSTSRSKRWWP